MTRRRAGLILIAVLAAVWTTHAQRPAGAAWLIRSIDNPSDRQEQRADVLDAPVLPGSVMKTVALVAALESHVIEPDTVRMCRRDVTVDGHRYVCSHPDLKRPLTPAEALAHSCNDFFVSLARSLSRTRVNDVRARVGLPPIPPEANFAAALVGLDGPRVSPRLLLDSMIRLAGSDRTRPFTTDPSTRRTLLEGLRGAASYGSASELGARQISALAKTGTAPMPGGGVLGLTVALTPADSPRRAVIVVAPGAAGRDATSIAGDLLAGNGQRLRVGSPGASGTAPVSAMDLEDYVARVVAGEGNASAPESAQQALAVAARTFALANRDRHRAEGFDLCDTTHCQVLRPATAASERAARATAGRVLLYRNEPAPIFYSASCGGQSALPSEVWPGATNHPFLPAQKDEACGPEAEWTSAIAAADIERALQSVGRKGTGLRTLSVVTRSASGRVARLAADGFSPAEISGEDFRLAIGRTVGWQLVKSTQFVLRRDARGYVFTGRGFGHGVGMCVAGAACRAAAGATTDAILGFYYPGLRIGEYRANAAGTVAPDVRLALPAAEEGERAAVIRIVRQGRDEVAARAGLQRVPLSIRVTVHPTAASFARASRQPWWVAGAARNDEIDLLPLTILRQRRLLESTIRHEVAHVVLHDSLLGKPMWVQEGAASHFSDPSPAPQASRQPSAGAGQACPADADFLNALSADALQDLYARALGCFRGQLSAGRKWTEIR